jgi:hypothetical protein
MTRESTLRVEQPWENEQGGGGGGREREKKDGNKV